MSGCQVNDSPRDSTKNRYYGSRHPALVPGNQEDRKQVENRNGDTGTGNKIKIADNQYEEKSEKSKTWLGQLFKDLSDFPCQHDICRLTGENRIPKAFNAEFVDADKLLETAQPLEALRATISVFLPSGNGVMTTASFILVSGPYQVFDRFKDFSKNAANIIMDYRRTRNGLATKRGI